jgi:mRNA interferase MazF
VVKRGEVWWYEAPDEKRRPYLILTRNEAIPVLNRLLAVPATGTIRGIPSEIPLDVSDGMPKPCVLIFDSVTVVRKALLVEKITSLPSEVMNEVCAALAYAAGCPL